MSAEQSINNIKAELQKLQEQGLVNPELRSAFDNLLSQINIKPALEYYEAIYAFQAQQQGDLNLKVGDKVQLLEKVSKDWYKGRCGDQEGIFPSNYVKPAMGYERQPSIPPPPQYNQALAPQQTADSYSSNNSYPQQQVYPAQNTGYYQQPQQPQQQPFPPASTNYYQQPQQVQPVQQQQEQQQQPAKHNDTMSKIGGKLGNAFIFGAGASLGGDLVNSIF